MFLFILIQQLAFDYFKKATIPEKYAKKFPDLYASILGVLSEKRLILIFPLSYEPVRFAAIVAKLNDEAKEALKNKTKVFPSLIQGIRFLKIKLNNQQSVDEAVKLITFLYSGSATTNLQKAKKVSCVTSFSFDLCISEYKRAVFGCAICITLQQINRRTIVNCKL